MTPYDIDLANTKQEALRLADDAFSQSAYATGEWDKLAGILVIDYGFSAIETAAILKSKLTRWAADAEGSRSGATADAFMAWFKDPRNRKITNTEAIAELVRGTFPSTEDADEAPHNGKYKE